MSAPEGYKTAGGFLEDWKRTGVAEHVLPGRWALTASGRAMFSAYVSNLDLIDNREGAAA